MIKTIYTLSVLLFITNIVIAQFSTKTELRYLQLVNKQQNIKLIEGNLFNAELTADSIIIKKSNSSINSEFFFQLASSYFYTARYDLALFSLLRQRCLFPNEAVENESEPLFYELAYRNSLTDSVAINLWNSSAISDNKSLNFNKQLINLLHFSIGISTKATNTYIYNVGMLLRSFNANIPSWYKQWEFLTLIGIDNESKRIIIKHSNNLDSSIYNQIDNNKLRNKVYRKAICHYKHNHSNNQAAKLLNEYKSQDLSFCERIGAFFLGF